MHAKIEAIQLQCEVCLQWITGYEAQRAHIAEHVLRGESSQEYLDGLKAAHEEVLRIVRELEAKFNSSTPEAGGWLQ